MNIHIGSRTTSFYMSFGKIIIILDSFGINEEGVIALSMKLLHVTIEEARQETHSCKDAYYMLEWLYTIIE